MFRALMAAILALAPHTSTFAAQLGNGRLPPPVQPRAPQTPAPADDADTPGRPLDKAVPAYVIGPEDVLSIVFWRDADMSTEVVVRPDGNISVPLLNDIKAAGKTPEQLRQTLVEAASKFVAEPNATVVVKQINSQKVFITGSVTQPGTHPLTANMTVMQLIAIAGGLLEYAQSNKIVIIRNEGGRPAYIKFNYDDVIRQRGVEQNVVLRPGDTVVVP